jgi:hypothetical protein
MSGSRTTSNRGVLHLICTAPERKRCAIPYSLNLTGAQRNPPKSSTCVCAVPVRFNDSLTRRDSFVDYAEGERLFARLSDLHTIHMKYVDEHLAGST